MRPRYESEQDLGNEEAVAKVIAEEYALDYRKGGQWDHFDYRMVGKEQTTLIEIKCRQNPRYQYQTLMISAQKIVGLVEQAHREGAWAVLVVKWTDTEPMGINLYNPAQKDTALLNQHHSGLWFGGREDRGDAKDVELTFHFKVSDFTQLVES